MLPSDLARRAGELVGDRYRSISELLVVSLRNQLELEGHADRPPGAGAPSEPAAAALSALAALAVPSGDPPHVAPDMPSSSEPLSLLTNRLVPVKVATRVLAGLAATDGEWPNLRAYQRAASAAAREVGLRLQEDDLRRRAKAYDRSATGFPTGDDSAKALARFVTSFTIVNGEQGARGPLAVLGLARIVDGKAVLTETGWRLSVAASPALGEAPGANLSEAESTVITIAIRRAVAERHAVGQFLRAVDESGGLQRDVEALLLKHNPGWSMNRLTAERAAMVGRLRDLGIIRSAGRGGEASITILERGRALLATLDNGDTHAAN